MVKTIRKMVFWFMHKKKVFTIIFIIFCFVGILTTTCLLVSWKNDVSTNLQVKKKLEKYLKKKENKDIKTDKDKSLLMVYIMAKL